MADPDTKQSGQKNQGEKNQAQKNQGKWDPAKDKAGSQHNACQDKNAPGKFAGQNAPIHSRRDDDARADQNRGDQNANPSRQSAENATGMDDEDFKTPASENENPDKDAENPGKSRDQRPM